MDLTNLNQVDTTAEHAIISFSVINTGGEQKHRKKKAPFCRIMILFGIISYTQCSRNGKNSAKIDLFTNIICYFVVGCNWNHEMSFCEIGFSLKIFAPFCGFQSIFVLVVQCQMWAKYIQKCIRMKYDITSFSSFSGPLLRLHHI